MRKVLTSKSFAKTMSWMLVSGVIIAIPTLVTTGSLVTALGVAFWACLFKTPVYWLHEVVWSGRKQKAVEKRFDQTTTKVQTKTRNSVPMVPCSMCIAA